MVISAISIIAINPESEKQKEERDETLPCGVKKINDMGVFSITALFSLIAYLWLFLVLAVISPDRVEIWEAWVTLAMFFVLMLLAYIADRCKAKSDSKITEEAEKKAAKEYMDKKTENEINTGNHHVEPELFSFSHAQLFEVLKKEL
jgi:Ca2+/Na+ antiporter